MRDWWNRLICRLFKHGPLEVLKVHSNTSCRVRCKRCGQMLAVNTTLRCAFHWDDDFQDMEDAMDRLDAEHRKARLAEK